MDGARIFLGFLLFWQCLNALTVEELLRDSAAGSSGINSYQAEIVTIVESPLLGRRAQTGRISYQYPDKTRTDIFEPPQTILNTAGRTYVIAAGQIEEIKTEINAALFKQPENLLAYFTFQLEDTGAGWRLSGAPLSADPNELFSSVYFSRLALALDAQKNITEINLYNSAGGDALQIKNFYETIDALPFPVRTEVFLPASKIKTTMEYKQIRLNVPLAADWFDPQAVAREK